MLMLSCFAAAAIACYIIDNYFPDDRPLTFVLKRASTYLAYSLIAIGICTTLRVKEPVFHMLIAVTFFVIGALVGYSKAVHQWDTFRSGSKKKRKNIFKDAWNNKGKLVLFLNAIAVCFVSYTLYENYRQDVIYCAQPKKEVHLDIKRILADSHTRFLTEYLTKIPHSSLGHINLDQIYEHIAKPSDGPERVLDQTPLERTTRIQPEPIDEPKEYKPRCDPNDYLEYHLNNGLRTLVRILTVDFLFFAFVMLILLTKKLSKKRKLHGEKSKQEVINKYLSLKDAYRTDPDEVKLMMIEKIVEKHPWLIDMEAEKKL